MPRVVDYPRASMPKSIELAEAVYQLGGTCTMEMAAESLHKKIGGGFKAIVAAAVKHNLIEKSGNKLSSTALFKSYHLGYSEDEKSKILQEAFLSVPLYGEIYRRFETGVLPVEILDKLLIREFDVNQQVATRVARYFVDGAKTTNLLGEDHTFTANSTQKSDSEPTVSIVEDEETPDLALVPRLEGSEAARYTIRISGPGMNSQISITEEEDLAIVEVMLQKVRKGLRSDVDEE